MSQREQCILKLIVQTRQRDNLKPLELTADALSDDARLELTGWLRELDAPIGEDSTGAPLPAVPDHLLGQVHRLALGLQGARPYFAPSLLRLAWQKLSASLRAPAGHSYDEARWEAAYQMVDQLPAADYQQAAAEILLAAESRYRERDNLTGWGLWDDATKEAHVRAVLARRFFVSAIAQAQV